MKFNEIAEKALEKHYEWQGKIEMISRAEINSPEELALAYTPGVAAACLEIEKNPALSFRLTRRGKIIAVVTDGSAVLGLGNIGALAAMPVMEGKCALFKRFGNVDAVPLCLNTQNTDEIVETVARISGSFGGINLEDISAPRCFEIEKKLKERLNIPVFHDDQHGTAICTAAAVINALKLTGKRADEIKCVISGAGAAGCAVAKRLLSLGIKNIIVCNSRGAIYSGRSGLDAERTKLGLITNPNCEKGGLTDVLKGADVFIGVSAPNILKAENIAEMNSKPTVLALANPVPEIDPKEAIKGGAAVVGTGRSDFPNQINNVLVFPGIFKGALEAGAAEINDEMMTAAVYALAELADDKNPASDRIIPDVFDDRVAPAVAEAVTDAAIKSGAVLDKRR